MSNVVITYHKEENNVTKLNLFYDSYINYGGNERDFYCITDHFNNLNPKIQIVKPYTKKVLNKFQDNIFYIRKTIPFRFNNYDVFWFNYENVNLTGNFEYIKDLCNSNTYNFLYNENVIYFNLENVDMISKEISESNVNLEHYIQMNSEVWNFINE